MFDYQKVNRVLNSKINDEIKALCSFKDDSALYKYKKIIEGSFARYIGKKHCYFVDSGTTATQLALKLLGVGRGDEVILPLTCYPSIILSVIYAGATPVFVDIKEDFTIDEDKIEEKITRNTKVIIPVHLFGHACNLDKIKKIAEKHNLKVIEDACQAHGSTLNGKKLGSFGDIGVFSFTYHKTISSIGGGGALVFNDQLFYEKLEKMLKIEKDDELSILSGRAPGRMSFTDMAVLNVKVRYSKVLENDKIQLLNKYESAFARNDNIKLAMKADGEISVRQMFVGYFKERDSLVEYLASKGVVAKPPYKPVNKIKIFSKYCKGEFPVSERYFKEAMFLPMHLFMTKEELDKTTREIENFYRGSKS